MSTHLLFEVGDLVTWGEPDPVNRPFIDGQRKKHGEGPFQVQTARLRPNPGPNHPQLLVIQKDGKPVGESCIATPAEWSGFWFRKI